MTNELANFVDDKLDQGRPEDGRETVDNRERGCGYLKPNAAYVRSDVAALSAEGGEMPRFVELDEPIEYREGSGRGALIPGYKPFPGESFSKHYLAEGHTTTPSGDMADHFDRLDRHGFDGDHYGDITSAHATDLLMSVGETNWETPDEYVAECRERGLNLKIPVSPNKEPPAVEPLRTRVWVVHPNGAGDGRPGIIGYAYLTRTIFTTGTKSTAEDPDIPKWAEDMAKAGKFDVVERGEPIAEDDPAFDPAQSALADHIDEDGEPAEADLPDGVEPEDFEVDHRPERKPVFPADEDDASDEDDRDVATITVADDEAAGDVSGLEVEFGRGDVPVTERRESFDKAVDEGPLTYNALKVIAGNRDDVDVGAQPPQDELVTALVDDAYAVVPAYHDPKKAKVGGSA